MRFFSTIALLLSVVNFTSAQIIDTEMYLKKEFLNGKGDTLRYRQMNPLIDFSDCESGKKYPLVIFLHGAGERGNDNEKQLIHGSKLFSNIKNRIDFQSFVIFPQCPENNRWVEVDWKLPAHDMPVNLSKNLELVMNLLDELIAAYPIDTNRIYVAGLSMGGFGTWDLISRYPERFAAALPICGGGDVKQAGRLVGVPIWTFHGGNDKLVLTQRSRDMVDALKKAGGSPKYSEYPGVGHDSWNKAFAEPELLKWLFSQSMINRK